MKAPPLDAGSLERFRAVIAARLGLVFQDRQLEMLDELLRSRLLQQSMDVTAYLNALEAGLLPTEMAEMAPDLTVGETYFFRNIEQFHALRELVLPALLAERRDSRRLRILSAGCASGEELYSIAMVLQDLLPGPGWELDLLGVDVNPVALDKARQARYSGWSLRETPAAMRERWFRPQGSEFILDPQICGSARFELLNLNLAAPDFWRPGAFDLVFARNVLMYFSPEALRAAIARISGALSPHGYFFFGHSESMRELSQDFRLCHTHGTFYYQRANGDAPAPRRTPGSWFEEIGHAVRRVRSLTSPPPASPPPAPPRAPPLDEALSLFAQERFEEATRLLDAMGPAAQRDRELLLLRAMLLVHAGQFQQAEDAAHAALTLDAHCAAGHYVIAVCRESLGDLSAAMNRYGHAARLDPGFALPPLHLGLLARRRGDAKLGRKELERALALLEHESTQRLVMFGGGFDRRALRELCRAELRADGVTT